MGAVLAKFLKGETDVNENGKADIKELLNILINYLKNRKRNND
jgi:hypothetical protein